MADRNPRGLSPWYTEIPDCDSLLQAVNNLTSKSVKEVPMGILDGLPARIAGCLESQQISQEDADKALSHLNQVQGKK